jgi:hypothetical protein
MSVLEHGIGLYFDKLLSDPGFQVKYVSWQDADDQSLGLNDITL